MRRRKKGKRNNWRKEINNLGGDMKDERNY